MTEKRFECDKGSRIIIDNETKLHYIMTLDWECRLVTKLLNNFVEENEQLQIHLSQLAKSNREGVKKVQSLAKEKENLKDEVYEEMDNALTVLRELYEDTPLKSQSKMNNLYNRLESLREEMK